MNLIYKITNTISGKVYIGQTTRSFEKRKCEHISRFNLGERDHKLYLAIKKYGLDCFTFEPYFNVLNKHELDSFEKIFIKEYNSFNRGYNMTEGGNSLTDETKDKIRQKMCGRKITWYNKILETRKIKHSYGKVHKIKFPGGQINTVHNLKEFCKSKEIDYSNLYKTKSGRNCCKGYFLLETFND